MVISQAERDAQSAELRKLRADAKKREEADSAADAERKRVEAEERKQYDQALAAEQERTKAAEAKAAQLAKSNGIRDEITRLGYSGEQATAIQRLVSSDAVQVDANGEADPISTQGAVEAVLKQYPALFKQGDPPDPDKETPPVRSTPQTPPANPPAPQKLPTGYISPEEYTGTPLEARRTEEFQKRVTLSRPHWPDEVPATTFAQEG